ncbi:MAG: riboflavin synthase [Phycisphaerales bacterium]|nr:riboflavin synthase [Phycisphaerales bacterium]
MFTGIVQAMGRVAATERTSSGLRLEIEPTGWDFVPSDGDSISVDGCCLTVVGTPTKGGRWRFDAVPETLAKTTVGDRRVGDVVNLEHSATASTFLGGHVVQGHVDGVAVVESVVTSPEWRVRVRPPAELMQYMTPKGSVCVSGVSLTLAAVDPGAGWFEVALIPTTLEKTNLRSLAKGSRVNIEADTLVKTMVHWMRHYAANAAR